MAEARIATPRPRMISALQGSMRLNPVFPFHIPQRQGLLALEEQMLVPDIGIGGNRKSFPRGAGIPIADIF